MKIDVGEHGEDTPQRRGRIILPKVFEWYSEDFGGKEQILLWLLGVLPTEQRERLELLLERRRDVESGDEASVDVTFEEYKWDFRYFVPVD
eukprot:COSAG01_NODE_622_length_14779_cov_69.589305_8_plen_91_part_00